MLKYLNDYHNEFREQLNIPLMNKEFEEPLVEYIKDTLKSLEIVPAIKILKFEYTDRESDIDINRYIFKREKRKKKKDRYDYKMIADSRCGSLTAWIEITLPEKDPKTNEVKIHRKVLKKSILIPLIDEDGYYYIKGKRYFLIYQLLEKSTYVGNQTITLKSLMPVALKRNTQEADGIEPGVITMGDAMVNDEGGVCKRVSVEKEDIYKRKFTLPVYNIFMFRKEIPAILFYMANGIEWALDFLGVSRLISFESSCDPLINFHPDEDDNELWFPISSKCYIHVKSKKMFEKYPYIQSVVGGLLHVCSNRFTPEHISDTSIWIKKLGNGNYNKGIDMLTFFNRLLDITTQRVLLIDEYHKRDIYSVVRWMMMNFNKLRKKDNLNLYNKRIRCNEYISSLLTLDSSRRLNWLVAMGNKATMDNYKDIFKFPGEILLQKMHVSGVLRFDEQINDMTFFSKFKATFKGPHAMGGQNSKRISVKSRGIHPSYLENLDILVCGSSDPGTSALLSPWNKMNGFYFDDKPEEDEYIYEFNRDMDEFDWEHNQGDPEDHIRIEAKDKDEYLNILNKLSEFGGDIQVFGTSKDDLLIINEGLEDIDDRSEDKKETDSSKSKSEN